MMQLAEHPSKTIFGKENPPTTSPVRQEIVDWAWLRQTCLEAGAVDVGFAESRCPEIADQKSDIRIRRIWSLR